MTKLMSTAALLIALAAPQAQAGCETPDLRGRWDVYGIADRFGFAATLDCVFLVNKPGRFARSICITRVSGESERTVVKGDLTVKRSCQFSGEFGECRLDGTMTRAKDMVSGTAVCKDDDGTVMLFNMVRRQEPGGCGPAVLVLPPR